MVKKIQISEEVMGGWPLFTSTLRDILEELGFKEEGGKLSIELTEKNNLLLDSFVRLLTDDGMGYGVSPEYIVEVDNEPYETTIAGEKVNVINFFREKVGKEFMSNEETE